MHRRRHRLQTKSISVHTIFWCQNQIWLTIVKSSLTNRWVTTISFEPLVNIHSQIVPTAEKWNTASMKLFSEMICACFGRFKALRSWSPMSFDRVKGRPSIDMTYFFVFFCFENEMESDIWKTCTTTHYIFKGCVGGRGGWLGVFAAELPNGSNAQVANRECLFLPWW